MCILQHQLKATMDSLTSKVPQFLLQQGKYLQPPVSCITPPPPSLADILEYYLVCSDLNSPAEFLTRYNTPTHILLDRGKLDSNNNYGYIYLLCRVGVAIACQTIPI